MADSKISALPAATTPLAGTEVLPIVQSGATDQVTVANLTAGRAVSALSLTSTNDATINGLTVGKGLAAVATNTAVGVSALGAITTGSNNTAVGGSALALNTTGASNNAFGSLALNSNTGNQNNAFGVQALYLNTTGTHNNAFGYFALRNNTTGSDNNIFGWSSLSANTTGNSNLALGGNALNINTTGSLNVSAGQQTLQYNTIANNQTAIGVYALQSATSAVATLGAITGGTGYNGGGSAGPLTVQASLSSGSAATTYPTLAITVASGVITVATLVTFGRGFLDTTTVLTVTSAAMVTAGFAAGGSGFSIPVATLATGASNVGVGYQSGSSITTGSNNVIIGGYTGSAAPISATGSNYVVLSDGAGNVRQYFTGANATFNGTITPQQATTAAAPTYVKGAMYFDTTLNKLRIGGATAWETVTSV